METAVVTIDKNQGVTLDPLVSVTRNGADLVVTHPTGMAVKVSPHSQPYGIYSQALMRVRPLDGGTWFEEPSGVAGVRVSYIPKRRLEISHLSVYGDHWP